MMDEKKQIIFIRSDTELIDFKFEKIGMGVQYTQDRLIRLFKIQSKKMELIGVEK